MLKKNNCSITTSVAEFKPVDLETHKFEKWFFFDKKSVLDFLYYQSSDTLSQGGKNLVSGWVIFNNTVGFLEFRSLQQSDTINWKFLFSQKPPPEV